MGYPRAFRQVAVERMKWCDNVLELAQELAVHRAVLYQWRDQFSPQDQAEWHAAGEAQESRLEPGLHLSRVRAPRQRLNSF